jgi:hypothetical protein
MQMLNTRKSALKPRRIGAAEAYMDTLLAVGRVAFSLADLVKQTGLSSIAGQRQLARLGAKVASISPRQPFFLIVTPEHRNIGAPPATAWLHDYFHWLGRPYYVALQSAAGLHGSNPQALQVTQVMTDRPRREITVGRIRVSFFVKHGIQRTPVQQLARASAPLCISTPEATTFDLIRYATSIGGIERAAETIGPLLALMRVPELRRVLAAENEPAIARRLGFVMETAGAEKLARVVHDWLPARLTRVPLSPLRGETENIPLVERWQVLNNSRTLKS